MVGCTWIQKNNESKSQNCSLANVLPEESKFNFSSIFNKNLQCQYLCMRKVNTNYLDFRYLFKTFSYVSIIRVHWFRTLTVNKWNRYLKLKVLLLMVDLNNRKTCTSVITFIFYLIEYLKETQRCLMLPCIPWMNKWYGWYAF